MDLIKDKKELFTTDYLKVLTTISKKCDDSGYLMLLN